MFKRLVRLCSIVHIYSIEDHQRLFGLAHVELQVIYVPWEEALVQKLHVNGRWKTMENAF